MEIWEFKAIQKVWESKNKQELILWRMSAYYQAAHFFEPKKPTPKIEEWYPFYFDEQLDKSTKLIPIEEKIAFFKKIGKENWIPKYWYDRSPGT